MCFPRPPCPSQAILQTACRVKAQPLSLAAKARHWLAFIRLPCLTPYSSQTNPLLAPGVGRENVSKLLQGDRAEWLRAGSGGQTAWCESQLCSLRLYQSGQVPRWVCAPVSPNGKWRLG